MIGLYSILTIELSAFSSYLLVQYMLSLQIQIEIQIQIQIQMHTSNEQQTHQNIYKGGNQQTFFDQPLSSNYRSVWRVQSILALMVIVSRGRTADKQQQTIERQDKRTAKMVNKEMINDFDLSSNGHFRPLHPRAIFTVAAFMTQGCSSSFCVHNQSCLSVYAQMIAPGSKLRR